VSRENVDTARRSIDAWNRGDVDAFVETFHPEGEFISEIAGRVEGADEAAYRRHAGLRRFWDEWHSVWDLTIEVSELRDVGDAVLTLGRMRARGKTSGVELESPVAYVGEFQGGLCRKLRAYLDQAQALKAVELPHPAHSSTED
jgi:ketosteroid isomerase-like protein